MMFSLPISGHRAESCGEGTLLFAIIAGFVLTSPLFFIAMYATRDGEEYLHRMEVAHMAKSDPVRDARMAIETSNLRLYALGSRFHGKVPGFPGTPRHGYDMEHGYRYFALIEGEALTEDQKTANRAALKYMESYNRTIHAHVTKMPSVPPHLASK